MAGLIACTAMGAAAYWLFARDGGAGRQVQGVARTGTHNNGECAYTNDVPELRSQIQKESHRHDGGHNEQGEHQQHARDLDAGGHDRTQNDVKNEIPLTNGEPCLLGRNVCRLPVFRV